MIMTGSILSILLLAGIIVIYVGSYALNANTDVPQGVEKIDKCSTCGSGSCSLSSKTQYQESESSECDLYEEK
jgi:multisubunit Na+/H+ antiporter MnhG subunit